MTKKVQIPSTLSVSQNIMEIFEKRHVVHSVVLSLWDNVSGPRIEQLWTNEHHAHLMKAATSPDLTTISNTTNATNAFPSTHSDMSDVKPNVKKKSRSPPHSSSSSDDNNTLAQMRLNELIQHAPRYTLGGEMFDSLWAMSLSSERNANVDSATRVSIASPTANEVTSMKMYRNEEEERPREGSINDEGTRELVPTPDYFALSAPDTIPLSDDPNSSDAVDSNNNTTTVNLFHIQPKIHWFRLVNEQTTDSYESVESALSAETMLNPLASTASTMAATSQECVVVSLVFSSLWESHATRFSFSWFFVQCTERVALLQPVLLDRMQPLVVTYATALMRWTPSAALRVLRRLLPPTLDALDDVFNLERPLLPLPTPTTIFLSHTPATSFSLSPPASDLGGDEFHFAQSLYVRKRLAPDEMEFLSKVVTSHLQTFGCTVVLGTSETDVNSWIATLGVWLTERERAQSCFAVSGRPYVPGVLLQGLVVSADSNRQTMLLDGEQLLYSLLPTTIVDLVHRTVLQTRLLHEYIIMRREWRKSRIGETLRVNKSSSKSTTDVQHGSGEVKRGHDDPTVKSLLVPVRQASPLITHALHDTFALPTRTLRFACLRHALVQLIHRASTLLHYTCALRAQDNGGVFDYRNAQQHLCRDLELVTTDCFYVVLALAEKLSPGIYTTLAGDPTMLERKIISLFDSF
jgi:hypothetical protein